MFVLTTIQWWSLDHATHMWFLDKSWLNLIVNDIGFNEGYYFSVSVQTSRRELALYYN